MESKESPILQGLNPAQRAAVVNYDAPSLIIAGAGSGKTRVLTSRIAYMIEQGVAPFNILALTFTNKAAEQMRERIAQMIPDNRSRYIRMGTFHSVFSRILRENADRIGFPDSFTIYEPSDCKNLLKTIVRELNLPDEKYKPNVLSSRISYAKNCLVTPGAYLANSTCAAEDRQAQIPEFGNIYNIYCQRCKRNGAMDFDDLLLQTNILLRDCPDVLARYQEQFQYILVDEYQDTNYAQYTIIRRLSQTHSKVCVVGDDAQSIYSFRGAKIENILSFQRDYPEAKVFNLEQNYRSTQNIVNAANSIIAKNDRVTAINSALQVDITGQVCADSLGTKFYSGVGGQIDFIYGASLSKGGKAIIAMPSVTNKGISKIAPELTCGAGVVTTRNHIHWFVTENGAVNLYGKSLQERARLIISIADPSAQESLDRAAFERYGQHHHYVKNYMGK